VRLSATFDPPVADPRGYFDDLIRNVYMEDNVTLETVPSDASPWLFDAPRASKEEFDALVRTIKFLSGRAQISVMLKLDSVSAAPLSRPRFRATLPAATDAAAAATVLSRLPEAVSIKSDAVLALVEGDVGLFELSSGTADIVPPKLRINRVEVTLSAV
jgi:hypothetical protein